jgi:hypothetical protein
MIDLPETAGLLIGECFRQLEVETVVVAGDAAGQFRRQKFDAAVVKLDSRAASSLESIRASNSNSRIILCGVGGSAQEALRYSRFGLNAMFVEPLERQAVLRLARATRNLIFHEYKRYVRVPLITQVSVALPGRTVAATSHDISSGGLSFRCGDVLSPKDAIEVRMVLSPKGEVRVRARVVWVKKGLVGARFIPQDDRRFVVKDWIDGYFKE